METVLLVLATGTLCIVCFFIGVKAGKKEKIKAPEVKDLNPIKKIQEIQIKKEETKEAELEKKKIETILENIDSYNGTAEGQKDV
jgi:hypothetical protein